VYRTDVDDTACLVVLSGKLDADQQSRVRELLPAPDRCARVVIDCSAVTSMDPAIVAVVVSFRREFQKAGGDPFEIVLIASPEIDQLVSATGIKRLVTVLPSQRA